MEPSKHSFSHCHLKLPIFITFPEQLLWCQVSEEGSNVKTLLEAGFV